MKTAIGLAIFWFVLAMIRIPLVESWSIIPDNNPYNWFNIIGLRLIISFAFVEIAILKHKTRNID